MNYDIVLMNRDVLTEDFAKLLGFSKLIFKEDFSKFGIIESKNYETDRKLIENKRIKVLVDPHVNIERDSLHFRKGGLNHIVCNLAHKNSVAVGFSLSSIDSPVIIGRIRQNIKLCRKYNVKILFFTFAKTKYELRSAIDLISLLRVLGMNGMEAKQALSFI
ncbi:hypothetical protein HYU23_02160 [Candidatus Woesearchaeota archaeon]|nr:hypothetical protein [Candidatus Woesearchaeota archaeon]